MQPPHAIRFQRAPRYRRKAITPAMLAASARALRREREAQPLFAAAIAAQQPTAEQRREAIEDDNLVWGQKWRRDKAERWRRARAILREMDPERRAQVLFRWSVSGVPGHPEYLLDMLRDL
jgi:hypothetical protein